MSVIRGEKLIFCEGKGTSLDSTLLNKIVENVSGRRPTIVPTGGKFSFPNFAQGYFYQNQEASQNYIVFRDRDFDVEPPEKTQLIELQKNTFATYRTCVENYLLDAELINEYWMNNYKESQENPNSTWGHKDSPGLEAIQKWIKTSAEKLKEYQAVRWALGDLVQLGAAREQLKTTWTGGSGNIPSSLTLLDCKTEAKSLICRFTQAVAQVSLEKFEASLHNYCNKFEREEFWQNKDYLIWFQGKDLKKMMNKEKSQWISLDKFFDWAIAQIDIEKHADLKELRTRIEQLSIQNP